MEQQLLTAGIAKRNISRIPELLNEPSQYFDVFRPNRNEVFVDCGCLDGKSAFGFAAWCEALSYDKIICFEPDIHNYEKCKNTLSKLGDCEVHRYAVSDKEGIVSFFLGGNGNSRIIDAEQLENVETVNTIDLDTFLQNQKVTFIKMDIEGAEYVALLGATQIIKEQKPRLAICLYHDFAHIVTIPKLLLSLRSDYKFKIRHYSMHECETVLFAE